MNRIFLRIIVATTILGFFLGFALALDAVAHPVVKVGGNGIARIASSTLEPEVVALSADPAVIAAAEALAVRFAASQGWADHCPQGARVIFISNVDAIVGYDVGGFTYAGDACEMYLEPFNADPARRAEFCQIYVHERLHEARNDGWHSDVIGHPLHRWADYAPCEALYAPKPSVEAEPTLTRRDAYRAVRKRVGRGWKIRAFVNSSSNYEPTGFDVVARRKICRTKSGKRRCKRRVRAYNASREVVGGSIGLHRIDW